MTVYDATTVQSSLFSNETSFISDTFVLDNKLLVTISFSFSIYGKKIRVVLWLDNCFLLRPSWWTPTAQWRPDHTQHKGTQSTKRWRQSMMSSNGHQTGMLPSRGSILLYKNRDKNPKSKKNSKAVSMWMSHVRSVFTVLCHCDRTTGANQSCSHPSVVTSMLLVFIFSQQPYPMEVEHVSKQGFHRP